MERFLARAAEEIAARWHTGELPWAAAGLAAQLAFFLRFFVQWLASERVKKSIVPHSFWYASLGGGLLLMTYAIHRRDLVFTLSQGAGVLIYLRNVHFALKERRKQYALTLAVVVAAAALVALAIGSPALVRRDTAREAGFDSNTWGSVSRWWIGFGILGSAVFFMRFVIQWIVSERRGESVMPLTFWYVSLFGGLMLLVYVIHVRDPVLAIGQAGGMVVYLRNIVLSQGERGKHVSSIIVLLILSAFLSVTALDSVALWASGEARAAQIAREMTSTGDYVVPHLNGNVALTKPPLYHWLTVVTYYIFGVGEFAVRIPSALAGVSAVIAVYLLGRRMFDRTTGFLAGVILATSVELLTNARTARTDMVYTSFTVSAIASFVYAATSARHGRSLYVLSFAFTGLAFMTKGPAGLFLPLVTGVGYLYLAGRKQEIGRIPWWVGIAVFLAITMPWHIAVALNVPAKALEYYFWGQLARWSMGELPAGGVAHGIVVILWNLARNSVLSLGFYVAYLFKSLFPWSLFLPAALAASYRNVRLKDRGFAALPLVWFVVGMAAFCLSDTRASRYMLPMLPAGAIMVACLWRDAIFPAEVGNPPTPATRKWLRISMWPLVAVSVIACVIVARAGTAFEILRQTGVISRLSSMDAYMAELCAASFTAHPWFFGTGAALFAAASLGALLMAHRGRLLAAFVLLAVVITGFLSIFAFILLPKVDKAYNVKPFVERLSRLSRGAPYAWVGDASLETLFYMGRPYDRVGVENVKEYLEHNPAAVVLVWESDLLRLSPETLGYARELMRARLRHRTVAVFGSPWRPPDTASPERSAAPDALSQPRA